MINTQQTSPESVLDIFTKIDELLRRSELIMQNMGNLIINIDNIDLKKEKETVNE